MTEPTPDNPPEKSLDYRASGARRFDRRLKLAGPVLWLGFAFGVATAVDAGLDWAWQPERLFVQGIRLVYGFALGGRDLWISIQRTIPLVGGLSMALGALFLLSRHPGRRGRILILAGAVLLFIKPWLDNFQDVLINLIYYRSSVDRNYIIAILDMTCGSCTQSCFPALLIYLIVTRRLKLHQ